MQEFVVEVIVALLGLALYVLGCNFYWIDQLTIILRWHWPFDLLATQ